MMERIMVVAAHPDDETLGCGGTILKIKKMGAKVSWVIVTHISEKDGFSARRVNARRREIERAAKFYNFDKVYELKFPTIMLDTIPMKDIVASLTGVLRDARPGTLFVTNRNDIHSDHRITFDCLMSAAKAFRAPFVKRIFMYEVLSETECAAPMGASIFSPNSFSDITEFVEKKIKAMNIYADETGNHPFPRSGETVRALAAFRGAIIGKKYAEGFQLLRDIW